MSVGELALIGAVALVVIGPEKLPKVARTLGALLGRMQRYVATVKSDISREIELDNLRQLELEMKSAGQTLLADVEAATAAIPAAVSDIATVANTSMHADDAPLLADSAAHSPESGDQSHAAALGASVTPHHPAPARDRR